MVYFNMPYKVKLLQPVVEFMEEIPSKLRAKVLRTVGLLEVFDPNLREPHAKKVSGWPGIFELRVTLRNEACRLFYFSHRSSFYVVTSGYLKKSMKLSRKKLDRASTLMKRFREEYGGTHENL